MNLGDLSDEDRRRAYHKLRIRAERERIVHGNPEIAESLERVADALDPEEVEA